MMTVDPRPGAAGRPATPPSELVELQRGTVLPWQCDNNRHLNFQFYCREFDQGARVLALAAGAEPGGPLPPIRHLRFHSELRAADIYRVAAARIADGPNAGALVHWISDADSGRLAATALDFGGAPFDCPDVVGDRVAAAYPRSLSALDDADSRALAEGDGWAATARNWVTAEQCSPNGEFSEQHFAAMLGSAASHAWERAGLGVAWAQAHNLGRVAVEARLRHLAPARLGDLLVLRSRLVPAGGKGVRLQHLLHRLGDGTLIASAEVAGLLIDMETRRAVPLPTGQGT
jgi:acyl-CoA thioester hydrolase